MITLKPALVFNGYRILGVNDRPSFMYDRLLVFQSLEKRNRYYHLCQLLNVGARKEGDNKFTTVEQKWIDFIE